METLAIEKLEASEEMDMPVCPTTTGRRSSRFFEFFPLQEFQGTDLLAVVNSRDCCFYDMFALILMS